VSSYVYAVHATKPDDTGLLEVVFSTEQKARNLACERSMDYGVLAAAVTRYAVDELGTRHALAWYVNGVQQPPRAARPGPVYPSSVNGRLAPVDGT
jgi:hypothetical protein